MRNLAIFGAGVPIMIVSGAVALGAISEFSVNQRSSGIVSQYVDTTEVSVNASAFVADGLEVWPGTESPDDVAMLVAQAAGLGQTRPFDQTPDLTSPTQRSNDSDKDSSDILVVSVTPITVTAEPPTSLPTAKRVAPVKKAKARTRSLAPETGKAKESKFKMPWQTGVFQ